MEGERDAVEWGEGDSHRSRMWGIMNQIQDDPNTNVQCLAVGKWKSESESLSRVWLFVTPWTVQSVEFSRLGYWSGQLFPSPGDLPNPGIKPRYPALRVDSLPAEPQGKPKNTGVGSLSLLQRIFWPKNWTGASCIAGGFFTNWAIREAPGIRNHGASKKDPSHWLLCWITWQWHP